ncbi:MAG: cytochrome c [SAR324 cluster bacterium]|nr:cytochrome c [SAR324 cluster bacterium]
MAKKQKHKTIHKPETINEPVHKMEHKPRKKKEPLALWVGLVVITLAGAGVYLYQKTPASLSDPPTSTQIEQGEQLFTQNCVSCHGPGARGENPNQPMGGEKPEGGYLAPALNGKGHAWHHPNETLFEIVKKGSIASDSPMRGFEGKLTDDEIVSTIQYFKSLWSDEIKMRHAMRTH